MSFKPSRSSGIEWDKAYEKASKYRALFFENVDDVTFDGLYRASKYLYYYRLNESKIRYGKELRLNSLCSGLFYSCMVRNLDRIYPKTKKALEAEIELNTKPTNSLLCLS